MYIYNCFKIKIPHSRIHHFGKMNVLFLPNEIHAVLLAIYKGFTCIISTNSTDLDLTHL